MVVITGRVVAVCYVLLCCVICKVYCTCSNSVAVTSEAELTDALQCAALQKTTDIVVVGTIYVEGTMQVAGVGNLTIRGSTAASGLEYFNNIQSRRLLNIQNSSVVLENLLLQGDGRRGCVRLTDSHATMRSLRIEPIRTASTVVASNGLGIYMSNSTSLIFDSIVTGWLDADDGGGIYLHSSSNLTLVRTNFTNNVAGNNGGAINVDSSCSLDVNDNCHFEENSAGNIGGAIYVAADADESFSWISESYFFNNTAVSGGAIAIIRLDDAVFSSDMSLFRFSNITCESNTALKFGGCLYIVGSGFITNSSLISNGAGEGGESIFM